MTERDEICEMNVDELAAVIGGLWGGFFVPSADQQAHDLSDAWNPEERALANFCMGSQR
jgi:bacteriocin-like protein